MRVFAVLLVAMVSAFEFSPVSAKVPPADLVFKNGNIYTVNGKQPKAEAVAVKGDRIVFVGSNGGAQDYVGENTRVIDLNGRTMVPGMTDAAVKRIVRAREGEPFRDLEDLQTRARINEEQAEAIATFFVIR